jgi:cystathionine gamma-synthase
MPSEPPSADPTRAPAGADVGEPPSYAGLAPGTVAITAGRPARAPDAPLNPAIVLSSTYHADGPTGYGRFGNPTWAAFEEALGALEGGRAVCFASGMAAVAAVLDLVPVGATVVAPRHAYSGTLTLLREYDDSARLDVRLVDVADTAAVTAACAGADLVWVETPTNPALEVADLPAVVDAAHAAGALVAVDNTFATPLVQRPLDHGSDLSVHSVTKFLSGHSDVILGAAVAGDDALAERLVSRRTMLGAVPGPVETWLALRGLRTLGLRMERAQANAAELAARLQGHPGVERVRYPGLARDPGHARAQAQMTGFGAIVCLEVAGGADAAERLAHATRLWVHATSLGGVESTLERRRRWPVEAPGIPPGLVRLSVGCEDVEDLWRDLDAALHAATSGARAG